MRRVLFGETGFVWLDIKCGYGSMRWYEYHCDRGIFGVVRGALRMLTLDSLV
jgi:hypothetical protein